MTILPIRLTKRGYEQVYKHTCKLVATTRTEHSNEWRNKLNSIVRYVRTAQENLILENVTLTHPVKINKRDLIKKLINHCANEIVYTKFTEDAPIEKYLQNDKRLKSKITNNLKIELWSHDV